MTVDCLLQLSFFFTDSNFGILSQKKIIRILKDVFGAEPPRHTGATKKLIFNKNKFDRLDNVYNLELEIKVGRICREKDGIGLDKHMMIPEAAVTEQEPADRHIGREGFSPESDETDESDIRRVKTMHDAIL